MILSSVIDMEIEVLLGGSTLAVGEGIRNLMCIADVISKVRNQFRAKVLCVTSADVKRLTEAFSNKT